MSIKRVYIMCCPTTSEEVVADRCFLDLDEMLNYAKENKINEHIIAVSVGAFPFHRCISYYGDLCGVEKEREFLKKQKEWE